MKVHLLNPNTLPWIFINSLLLLYLNNKSTRRVRGERDVWGPSRLPLHKKTGRQTDGEGREVQPRVNRLSSHFFSHDNSRHNTGQTIAGSVINRPPELSQWPYSHHGGSNLEAIIHCCVHLKRPNRWAAWTYKRQWVYYPSGGVVHTITQAQ